MTKILIFFPVTLLVPIQINSTKRKLNLKQQENNAIEFIRDLLRKATEIDSPATRKKRVIRTILE